MTNDICRKLPMRVRRASVIVACFACALLCERVAVAAENGEGPGPPTTLQTRTFDVDVDALLHNLSDFTNWTITHGAGPSGPKFFILRRSTGPGSGFGGPGGAIPFGTTSEASDEVVEGEFQAALRQHFANAGFDLSTDAGKAIAFDDLRQTVTITAAAAEMDSISSAMKKLGRWELEVNLKLKAVELPLLQREPEGLEYLDSVGISNRYTVVAGGVSLNATNLNGTPQLRLSVAKLTFTQFRGAIEALEKREDTDIDTSPEITTENGRAVQMEFVNIQQIITGGSLTTSPLVGASFPRSMPGVLLELDVVPVISDDANSVHLQMLFREVKPNDESTPFVAATTVSGPNDPMAGAHARLPAPMLELTLKDQETACIGNFVTTNCLPSIDTADPAKKRALADNKQKHILFFVTATIVNPDGTYYHQIGELPGR